jgi:hypothetical protein
MGGYAARARRPLSLPVRGSLVRTLPSKARGLHVVTSSGVLAVMTEATLMGVMGALQRRITNAVFAVYPDGTLVHYNCLRGSSHSSPAPALPPRSGINSSAAAS